MLCVPMMAFRRIGLLGALAVSAGLIATPVYRIYLVTLGSLAQLAWLPWGFFDLLIDYRAGFVRRGLLGAIIHHLSGQGSQLPITNRLVFANFCIAVFALTSLAVLRKRNRIRNLILVLIVPGGLFAWGITNQFFYRKEALFLSFLAVTSLGFSLLRSWGSPSIRRLGAVILIALILVAGPVLCLVHEGFLFLAAPANLILLLAIVPYLSLRNPTRTPIICRYVGAAYSVAIAATFLVECWFRGSAKLAQAIWQNLNPADRAMITAGGAVEGGVSTLSFSIFDALRMPFHVLISGLAWFWLVPILGLMLYCLTTVALDLDANVGERIRNLQCWSQMYAFLFLCVSPAFLIGWDWGRWIANLNLCFLVLWLAISEDYLPQVAPFPKGWRIFSPDLGAAILAACDSFLQRKRAWVIAALVIFAITFRFPESTLQPIDTTYVLHDVAEAARALIRDLHTRTL